MRPSWDEFWFGLTAQYAMRATCPRASIGCLLVKNKHLVAAGYNGAPSGESHCPSEGAALAEHLTRVHCEVSTHAEANALRNAVGNVYGATAYVVGPRDVCPNCRDALRQQGVADIRWRESVPTLASVLAEVVAWGRETFPASTDRSKIAHLREEVEELAERPDCAEEMADVLMILAHLAASHDVNLAAEVARKLAICRTRAWGEPDADGKIKTVKPTPARPPVREAP